MAEALERRVQELTADGEQLRAVLEGMVEGQDQAEGSEHASLRAPAERAARHTHHPAQASLVPS